MNLLKYFIITILFLIVSNSALCQSNAPITDSIIMAQVNRNIILYRTSYQLNEKSYIGTKVKIGKYLDLIPPQGYTLSNELVNLDSAFIDSNYTLYKILKVNNSYQSANNNYDPQVNWDELFMTSNLYLIAVNKLDPTDIIYISGNFFCDNILGYFPNINVDDKEIIQYLKFRLYCFDIRFIEITRSTRNMVEAKVLNGLGLTMNFRLMRKNNKLIYLKR